MAAREFELLLNEGPILAVLLALPAKEIAKLRAVSSKLRAAIDAYTAELLVARAIRSSARGHVRLRDIDRRERALFHEDFGPGWRARWRDGPTAQGVNDARYEHLEVRSEQNREGGGVAGPPSFLSISGGGTMNFNGVYHSFAQPVKPRRISFCARVPSRCAERAYANVFFSSSGAGPHGAREPMPTFWLSEHPEPEDLFSALLDLQEQPAAPTPRDERDELVGQLWLPNGIAAELRAPRARPAPGRREARALDQWARIEIELDWDANVLTTRVVRPAAGAPAEGAAGGAGSAASAPAAHEPSPYGVYSLLQHVLAVDGSSHEGLTLPTHVEFRTPALAGGLTHVYLFVWSEAEAGMMGGAPSEVHITDLWLEG